jgi:hypothetical protein
MGKHERIKDEPKPAPAEEAAPQAAPATEGDASVTPKMALASVEAPKVESPAIEAPAIELPKIEAPAIELPKIEAAIIEAPKLELASIEAPHIAPDISEPTSSAADDAAQHSDSDQVAADAPAAGVASRIFNRFNLLAASLVLAAAFGGMLGALAAYGLMRPVAAPAVVAARGNLEQIQALKESVVQARVDLAAMKVAIEAGNRAATAQLTRIGERIDRIERVQAEPAAKLNKAIETLDRLSRADAAAPKEVTGSIVPPAPAAGPATGPGGLDGWVVREVHRGTALIEGRMGLIEVDRGDVVPGLGRIEAIRKQDGRWVVVTTKGLIMSAR